MFPSFKRTSALTFCIMAFAFFVNSQQPDSLKTKRVESPPDSLSFSKLDSIFSASDSLSIFGMIDSLLNQSYDLGSSLVARAGYNSNIVTAGRTIGINQKGATAGLSYYHKSGLYADLTSYWSQEYNPTLYLTIASVGYLKVISKRYSVMASYDRFIYNNNDINTETPLTNMVAFSNFLDFKPITIRLDYSYYFGNESAHRLTPGVLISLRKYNFIGLDRISFMPSFQMLFGSAIITTTQFITSYRKLSRYRQYDQIKFGLMNYAVSFPLRITKKDWSLMASYTYNWPVALPGEDSVIPENSFVSITISKTINFGTKAKKVL